MFPRVAYASSLSLSLPLQVKRISWTGKWVAPPPTYDGRGLHQPHHLLQGVHFRVVLGKHLLLMVQVAPPLQGKEDHDTAVVVRTAGQCLDASVYSKSIPCRALCFGLSCQNLAPCPFDRSRTNLLARSQQPTVGKHM